MTKEIIILFLIGHIIGDFYLQSSKLADKKDESIRELIIHCMIYAFAMVFAIIPVFNFTIFSWSIIISLAHLIIDSIKFCLKKKILDDKKEALIYSVDQIIHILIIILIGFTLILSKEHIEYISTLEKVIEKLNINMTLILSWILITLVIIKPCSITIRKVLYWYKPPINQIDEGIPNAGALIGILERFIILLMLSVNQYAAIGFVLTAKSIARYNKIVEDPKFSEYYLLGTLLSTACVIISYLLIF